MWHVVKTNNKIRQEFLLHEINYKNIERSLENVGLRESVEALLYYKLIQ